MIRRNKLTMLLIAAVVMLSVYYFNKPIETTLNPYDDYTEQTSNIEYAKYTAARQNILEERNELLEQLGLVISNDEQDIDSKQMALETISKVNLITEKEVFVEEQILEMGYSDCLVLVDNNDITVSVVSEEFSVNEYIAIKSSVSLEFGEEYTVLVEVDTL